MRTDIPGRRRYLALFGILLLGLVLRCWGLTWGLAHADISRRPHPDEWVVYWVFQWFHNNHSLNPCASAATGCFFDWGAVYLYLSYTIHLIFGPAFSFAAHRIAAPGADPLFIQTVLAGRVTSVLSSTLTILVVYRLGRLAYGTVAGLIAALILSLSALPIQLAHFATPDSTTELFMSTSLLLLFYAMQQPAVWRYLVAGAVIGLGVGTEYHMALLAIPLVAAWALDGRRMWRWLGASFAVMILAYLISNPYAVIEYHPFLAAMDHTLRIRTVDSQAQYGDRWAAYGPGWLYVVRYALGYGVGFVLTIWLVLGVFWALFRRRRAELLLLAWFVPYFVLVTISTAKFMRYSAPLFPVLAVLAAGGAVELLSLVQVRRGIVRPLICIIGVGACLFTLIYDAAYEGLFSATDPRVRASAWLGHHALPGASVGFEQLPNGLINLPYYVASLGYKPCIAQFQFAHLSDPMDYIMVDSYGLEEHPRVPAAKVEQFNRSLRDDKQYRLVSVVHYVPTFLGLRFPIDGSPHDWRYPAHTITVFHRVAPSHVNTGSCYPDLHAAIAALYVGGDAKA